ncbi:hypothetical protein JOM56_004725, partial [Amanita muscaria]
LLDREGVVVGALAGRPRDETWETVHNTAFKALRTAGKSMGYNPKETSNRRGSFPTVAHGISFGGGQQKPGYLRHESEQKEEALEGLMKNKAIQRLCGFASSAFQAYSERNYEYMASTVAKVRSKLNLGREYDSEVGVFPCRSFNLGKQTATVPHRDVGNLAHSWCSITALGRFNPKLGGHLVLWDFALLVEFPPGSTVLIPSALFLHSNVPIQGGETRYSMVQYAAGGLFRWVNNGCKTDKQWKEEANGNQELEQRRKDEQDSRRIGAIGMFSRYEELLGQKGTAHYL